MAEPWGWPIALGPPPGFVPDIAFVERADAHDAPAKAVVATSEWAARRRKLSALGVPGLPPGDPFNRPNLIERRALAIAVSIRAPGIVPVAARSTGQRFTPAGDITTFAR
uniref:hypothetical protein n=1 Tax=Sphingomonas sp. TaxID=28214 RepID=UPI0025D9B0A5|nr:hypothetical protein [Sphingomonas sp.]